MSESSAERWGGAAWREAEEQAREDRWALRILTCPRAACRRGKTCLASHACPGLQRFPDSDDATALKLLRMRVEERLAELQAGPEAEEAAAAARAAARERRRRLAFARAREVLGRSEG